MLLDTHVLLWYLSGSPELPGDVATLIHSSPVAYVSAASIWEISIKAASGKLRVSGVPLTTYTAVARILLECLDVPFELMAITAEQCAIAGFVRSSNRDPFDRILATQAVLSQNPLVSRDSVFDRILVVKEQTRSRVTRIWSPLRHPVSSS